MFWVWSMFLISLKVCLETPGLNLQLSSLTQAPSDSKNFQEIVFGKKIACYLEVSKISSNRGKESDNVILRVWQDPDSNALKRSDFSILYYANDEKRQEHVEIHCK